MKLIDEKIQGMLCGGIFTIFLAVTLFVGWTSPSYNWDVFAYTGCALSLDNNSPTYIHEKAYSLGKEVLPAGFYETQTVPMWTESEKFTGLMGDFNKSTATNAGSFFQQLPFYFVKPLFIILLFLGYKIGINPIHSMLLISSLATLGIAVLLYRWLLRYISSVWATIWAICLLSAVGIQDLVTLTTPDTLSGFFIFLALYLSVEVRKKNLAYLSLLIATLIRVDNFLPSLMLLSYEQFFSGNRRSWIGFSLQTLLIAVIPLIVTKYVGSFGLGTLLYYTFIHRLDFPVQFHPGVSLGQYVDLLVHGIRLKAHSRYVCSFFILTILTWLIPNDKSRANLRHMFILGQILLVIRYAMFPMIDTRFLFIYHLAIGIYFVYEFGFLINGYPEFLGKFGTSFRKYATTMPSAYGLLYRSKRTLVK